ncbi:PilC/PilY family type IV pilus protein [Variovorax soli]|uniref:Type IV pilus assembly protein PilY1 n=1 Tax=Variovorax soli TaxID=376815 RepID=A0ABU1NBF8_9BURK|nr:PilC/PilY family type IV pilus protein [Variovorax soli]MDR6535678.1 type IV pilus assembly protein PilY1 [Variovorax soli]
MRPSRISQLGALALLTLASAAVRAEDIDIYQGTSSGAAPNMLIILDNAAAASASSSFTCPSLTVNDPGKNLGFEQCGLYGAVSAIGTNKALNGNINLGLMYFPGGPTNGGTFVVPPASPAPGSLQLMDGTTTDNTKGVGKMLRRIESLSLSQDKGNNNQIAQAMQEAWAFYQGKTGLSGTTYPGLANQQACARNFVLYITLATNNQKPQDSGNMGGMALQSAEGLSALPAQLALPNWKSPLSPYSTASSKYRSDYADEWANFMYTGTSANLATPYPGITTYTIILTDGSNPDYEQLMVSMANQGGGKYFLVKLGDVQALIDALGQVFNEVQAVNSVFAAPVLPVSANTQGTYLNQIYMGMFRPDADVNPRWLGNLKQYQFGVDITDPSAPQLFLADASWGTYSIGTNANRALSAAGTGFISPSAVSFWTSKSIASLPDSKGGFWLNAFKAQGASDGYDWADGQVVEKGGVSQQIRLKYLSDSYPATAATTTATTARNVYTCIGSSCSANASLSSMPFAVGNTNLTSTALGITASTVTAANLINWVRGDDTYAAGDVAAGREGSSPPDASITVRGSVHGDVLHSRPAVINYGGSTGVVVFYGANDGMFRAINGNQPNNTTDSSKPMGNCTVSSTCALTMKDATGATTSVPPGGELWSFVPPEFYPGLQRLYQNSPTLKLGTLSTGSAKNYFFDGAPSVYQNSVTGKAYIFLSARRGGRLLYALDVSDPTNPKFMWKRSNTSTGFAELGQTWSQPKVAMIKGHANPVLIFGAGYDTNEDAEPPNTDTMGRGIFIVDAVTGDIVWQAGPGGTGSTCTGNPCKLAEMNYAIPADVTLVDRDFDGYIDRLYAADTGGNIWRVDLQPTGTGDVSTWQATQVAALGGSSTTKRKFFFPPDVVLTKTYDVLLDITGDREHPLLSHQATSIVNRFYMIKDTKVGMSASGWTTVRDDTSSSADVAPTALFRATNTIPYDGSLSGFFVTLAGAGEKGVNAPTTVGGLVYFGTNQPIVPSSTSCQANLGTARSYAVNFLTGASSFRTLDGGGLAPSPVFGIVTVNVGGTERKLPFLIGGGGGTGADGKSGLGAQKPVIPVKNIRKRTYWYRETDR